MALTIRGGQYDGYGLVSSRFPVGENTFGCLYSLDLPSGHTHYVLFCGMDLIDEWTE